MDTTASKPLTDRERYEMYRNEHLHRYEKAVENVQYLVDKLNETRRKISNLQQEEADLNMRLEVARTTVGATHDQLTNFISTRKHHNG